MNNEIGVRVGEVIKALGMKKVRFAEQIGVDQSYMTKLSKGAGQPSDLLITSICREFNVNETWLRTGEGEMFIAESTFDLEEYIRRRGVTNLEIQILKAYFDLDSDLRERLLQHFKARLAIEQKKPTPVSEDGPKNAEEESLMQNVRAMSPGQQEQLFDQYSYLRTTRAPQKDASSAYIPPVADGKAPRSEFPDQS